MNPKAVLAPRDLFIDVRGLRQHVVEWKSEAPGATAERTIVLLHGWLDLARLFDKLAARLVDERTRVLALDFRGHGDSGHVEAAGAYHFPDYVADVHGVLAALVPSEKIALVGHSMGGGVAMQYAAIAPERVSHLTLIESLGPPRDASSIPKRLRGFVDDIARLGDVQSRPFPSVEAAAERVIAKHPKIHADDARHYAEHSLRSAEGGLVWKFDPRLHVNGAWPWVEEVIQPFLAAVAAPVQVIDGAEGFKLDAATRDGRLARIERVQRHVVAGAGHHVHLDAPDEVAALIRAFQSE